MGADDQPRISANRYRTPIASGNGEMSLNAHKAPETRAGTDQITLCFVYIFP